MFNGVFNWLSNSAFGVFIIVVGVSIGEFFPTFGGMIALLGIIITSYIFFFTAP